MTSKILLGGGCVLTLGAKTPNFTQADVLIEDGLIAEIGRGLRARDAELVDATDTIVMPGFVDAHRHTWTSLFRNLGGAVDVSREAVGDHYRPDDVYAATLIGLLGAVEAGITTVADWSEFGANDDLTHAALQAHADAGLRTVFVHAVRSEGPDGHDAEPATQRLVARLADDAGPTTTVALGTHVPDPTGRRKDEGGWDLARELNLRIHAHAGSDAAQRAIAAASNRGLLGSDVTLVHCAELTDDDVEAIASSGAAVCLTPASEMAGGRGSPPIQQLIDRDIRPGLGVDDERMAPGDLFAQMRATISLQHATVFDRKLAGKAGLPRLMSTRDVIRFATVDGARAAGLNGVTGSLEPGMCADVIVLRTDRPNVFPINDPIGAVVWGMDTSNLDWVIAGGRILMRHGALEADVQRARDLAATARRRVGDVSGLVVGAVPGAEG